jgi:protein TonB
MSAGAFLPDRSMLAASLPWLKAAVSLTAISLTIAGTMAVRIDPQPRLDETHGAEMVIEFAPVVTQAESRAQMAAAENTEPDQQATPELEKVEFRPPEHPDLPTEQTSPTEAEDPDLRMAQERTSEESNAAPERVQATEASEAKEQSVSSEASSAAVAAVEQQAAQPTEQVAAPDHGNARESERRIEAWQKAIFAHIVRHKLYPEEARKKNVKGEVVVLFLLDRRGGVSEVRVANGSGSTVLDQAAVEVLRRASPLPPPPADLRGERIELLLPMRYQLH